MDRQRGAGLVCCDTHGISAKRGALKKAEMMSDLVALLPMM